MEAISINRLEVMGNKVREKMDTCKDFMEFPQDSSGNLDQTHRVIVEKLRASVERLRTEIRNCMEIYKDATPDLGTKIEELTTLQIKAEDLLVEIDTCYSLRRYDPVVAPNPIPYQSVNARLPKLEMTRFDGNILRWHEFWDQFSSAIESRDKMSDVDKLSYLCSLIEGDAKRAIEGLDITNANYKIAVDRLTERFGKKGSLVDSHYAALQRMPKSTSDVHHCRRTLDEIDRHLRTLQSLGEDIEHKQLRATILDKFPDETMFDLRMAMTSDDHSVTEIRNLLEKVIGARESANRMGSIENLEKNDTKTPYTIEALYASINDLKKQFTPVASTSGTGDNAQRTSYQKRQIYNTDKNGKDNKRGPTREEKRSPPKRRRLQCIFCSGSHIHERCDQFKTTDERKQKLGRRCYLCLRDSHFIARCPDKSDRCLHCDARGAHNRCLCPTLDCKKEVLKSKEKTHTFLSQLRCDTVLQTATMVIRTEGSRSVKSRLLFDTGSQKTYVRSDVARQLKLKVIEPTCLTVFTFGSVKPKTIATTIVSLQMHLKEKLVDIQAYTIPTLTGIIPTHRKLREALQDVYSSLKIADDVSYDCAADIIIGNDYYHSIISGERIEVTSTLLLINSAMGWIPSGTYADGEVQHNALSVLTYFQQDVPDLGNKIYSCPDPAIRDDNIRNIWELEAIGIRDSPKVLIDDEIVRFFNNTTIFENGRYHVKWPWTQYPPELQVNFGLALGRLKSLIRRSDHEILATYNDVIQDQLNKGIVEVVTDSRLPDTHPVHYLPHHCVVQSHKTTKLRIVYDGSAKTKGQLSLNEYLYKGPLLLEDLTSLLLRFRQHPIGITADIEKAFLQVGLQTQDRDVTRFLWIKDLQKEPSGDNLIHLRFCRVPFGIISSPFLLAATIRKHLLKNDHIMTTKVAECLYVDNLVTGVDTEEEARSLFQQTRDGFKELSMNIREWSSNAHSFLNTLPQEAKVDKAVVSVLGLTWDTTKDMLTIAIKPDTLARPASTKRDILRIIASIFDPCGFTAPLTLPTRLFLQDLWVKNIKWDTHISQLLSERWELCKTFLKGVLAVSLPRYHFSHLITSPKDWSYELHCFTDASKDAYVAVVYLRASAHGRHFTSLIISRSRLTPIKRRECFTIPKLELLAVVIGTRLLGYVRNKGDIPIIRSFLWTDSLVALGWLRSERLLPPFVARRVAEVKSAEGINFRYVHTQSNPADVATRQPIGDSLPKLWIYGPKFLAMSSRHWPSADIMPEMDAQVDSQATHPNSGSHQYTSQVHASQSKSTVSPSPQPVSPSHTNTGIEVSTCTLPTRGICLPSSHIRAIQTEYYPNEQQGKTTPLSRSLGLYRDEDGVLRCKGRFANAEFPTDQKYPILLPRLAPVTPAIIRRIHEEHHHVGVLHTLSLLRQRYWVPQGRSLVARVLHRCDPCTKYGGGPYQLPGMPALPSERVTFSAPFTNTGLDYFGPLTTTENGIQRKRWACLFTCMAVRAIHIELVNDCSTEEFILAFRRFGAIRGIPQLVVSDNAANFQLAASTIDTFVDKSHSTRWKFIPALSPWFGGFYERMVGLVKNCLRRTLDQSVLTDTQLRTVLYEISATLNTRPLTAVSGDPDTILTPSHFLLACGPTVMHLDHTQTDMDASRVREQLLAGWKKTEALLRQFGMMFQSHYLTSLRERHRVEHRQPRIVSRRNPRVGDKVQVKGDTKNRIHWKVGTIASILNSTDGEIRTARVQLIDGTTLTRSVGQLYPLEMDAVDIYPDDTDSVDPPLDSDDTVMATGSDDVPVPNTTTSSHDNSNLSNAPSQSPLDPAEPLATQGHAQPPLQVRLMPSRPARAAAKQAIHNIRNWTRAMFNEACSTPVSP